MATRKAKARFALKRFGNFWRQYRKSKRGLIGLTIIVIFSMMGIFAPLIAPYAPIDPQLNIGKYPALGPIRGPKIADKLCTPVWYKYLPLPRGPNQLQESFHTNKTYLAGTWWALFGPIGEKAHDTEILLSKRPVETPKVEATFPNGTTRELILLKDWIWPRLRPREITFPDAVTLFPVGSNITVTYSWAVDITENVFAVSDFTFSSDPFDNIKWGSSTDSESINAIYNATAGYEDDGCIEITYDPQYVENESKQVVVFKRFEYPYWEPPKSFWGHISAYTDTQLPGSSVNLKITFQKELEEPIPVINLPVQPRPRMVEFNVTDPIVPSDKIFLNLTYNIVQIINVTKYPEDIQLIQGVDYEISYGGDPLRQSPRANEIHWLRQLEPGETVEFWFYTDEYISKPIPSTFDVVWDTMGTHNPTQTAEVAFPAPSDYTIAIEVTFDTNQTTTVLLDNFNFILYGNAFGLLGTDNALTYPRDIFSTLVHGTRVSLIVGVLSALFGTIIGLFLGLISGYVGGLIDETIMRIADLFLVLPTLPLFIILVVALKTVYGSVSMWNIILVLTLFGWMGFARSVRSMVLSLRERPFIEAARAAGAKRFYIINKHVLPNVFALVYITLATSVPGAIVTEASLSWLGLGDPRIASWGKLLYDFQSSGIATTRGLTDYWFWMFPASIAIAVLATAFILMGYALDEILNPRLRMRR